ncbi:MULTISPECIES: two-partner secretion domain-containing protein [Agrobacterium]|uniref:two-partner secretion domain-containing protein n=4 Tax=Rhizobium/Agrobacterium group TaxID=227290 RepID=UPI001F1CF225|nr:MULTISPECIES: hemagglutinin repeat-containing protein [Agrobacterium]
MKTMMVKVLIRKSKPGKLVKKATALVTSVSLVLTTIASSFAPASAQVITDPTAPIEFRPNVTSSDNGTPTLNIVKPSSGGVSHNKLREYNIDTRGLILNNSGLGGTSIIGGKVESNPNLVGGGSAKIIVNEVTGSRRSNLNGVTEVFGSKADVIVANPNGIDCMGCGFINTGRATLTTGTPLIDYNAGTVGLETRSGDITISGTGVSAAGGQSPDEIRLDAKSIRIDGLIDARGRIDLKAGSNRTDGSTGKTTAIAGDAAGQGIVSSAAGVVRAASIAALSSDLNTGISLAGNIQALGMLDANGALLPGALSLVSAGDIRMVSGGIAGNADLRAAGALQIARDLAAQGEISITARDVSLLDTATVEGGRGLSIVASADIVSAAVLKSGGAMTVDAGSNASLSGIIASVGNMNLRATDKLATDTATLVAPNIDIRAKDVALTSTWFEPENQGSITATNVEIGDGTQFKKTSPVFINAAEQLTIGTRIDTAGYPALAMAFRDLAISNTGVFTTGDHLFDVRNFRNAGVLLSSGQLAINAQQAIVDATGVIKAGTLRITTAGNLTNLGSLLSETTLTLLSDGSVTNDGKITAAGELELDAVNYIANSQGAQLAARKAVLILGSELRNNGAISALETVDISAGGAITNTGTISSNADLTLVAADILNSGATALIGTHGNLSITSGHLANLFGTLQANGSFEIAASGSLTNAGLLLGRSDLGVTASALTNLETGKIHAGRIDIKLDAGDLTNLGQMVSGETLGIVTAGSVLNDGVVQARSSTLRLEAVSYVSNSPAAELVAANANIILSGSLRNAGLIATPGTLTLQAAQGARNEASGEIVAKVIETKVVGDLVNLGKLVSETTLSATVSGLLANSGSIHAVGDLELTVADLINSGSGSSIASKGDITILASRGITNNAGSIASNRALTLSADTTLSNSGLLQGREGLSASAEKLDNQQAGRIYSGSTRQTENGTVPVGELTVNLSGSLSNLGQIVSANGALLSAAASLGNNGSIEAGGNLRLQTYSYIPGSSSARLVARNLDLILGSSFTNAGLLTVAGKLGLDVKGNLVNGATGKIDAGAIETSVSGNLHNLGSILTPGTLNVVVGGLMTNEALIHAGTGLKAQAASLANVGTNAALKSSANMILDISGNLDNNLGRIFAGGNLAIEVLATLTNASARIESGADMQIKAAALINTALDGTDSLQDYRRLGELSILYATERSSSRARYYGTMSAARDEFSGIVRVRLPGTIRAGANMAISGDALENREGRILAKKDLSIDMNRIFNDMVTSTVDHYRVEWRGNRESMKGSGKFHAPVGADPQWRVLPFSAGAFKDSGLAERALGGDRMIVISKGKSPITVTYSGKQQYRDNVFNDGMVQMVEYADAASLLDLAALGIDPNNIPDVIMIGNRMADIGDTPYGNHTKTYIGTASVGVGSMIKSGGSLMIDGGAAITNRGTLSGSLVSIEAGELQNGLGTPGGINGSGFGNYSGTMPVGISGNVGSAIGAAAGQLGVVNFVLDDVSVPPLDLGAFEARNLHSVNASDFGNLVRVTGSTEAARLLGSARIDGAALTFYADPVAEAKALAEAARQQAGTHLVVDPSLSVEEQREQLYRNAAEFAASTGARYGVALTEAQRAALEKPIVWHETRIIDGKPVLVPRLYLPSQDELLRGGRGAGLIAADDLLIDIDGKLNNSGAIVASGLASISASSILNQRLIDLDERDRALAGGRGDSGLISAGTLFMATDGDLLNRGGTLASAGDIDLRIGGSLINETERYTRTVDSQDGCVGKACGTLRTDYNVASITAGRDLTVIADRDIVNSGGTLGSVTDMLLAAGRDVTFETLKDSFVAEDYKKRGFLSGITVLRNEITTAEASAQSLVGDVSILAGYSVCDGGSLCAKGTAPGDVLLNGALVSAFDKLSIDATGKIDMGVVSEEVHNRYKEWGFKGLGWGSVKQAWNDVDTTVTRLSGNDVSLNAKGPITGTGVKIAAVNDLLMKTDDTIRLEAAQDALYFTEKGFYVGLSFPGSAGIDAALKGGSSGQILSGLAGINPVTAKLATLANADNGLAAGLAAVNLATTGASIFGGAAKAGGGGDTQISTDAFKNALNDRLNPLSQFTDENGNFSAKNFGINLSVWKSEQRWSESQISELTAGGDIVMKAGLDVILDQGTKMVSGGDVSIDAGRDILMAALVDYAKDKSSSFGLQLSLSSIGFDIGKSKGYDETLTNASITAAGNVSLTSGRDTALLGGNIIGRTVDLDVGRDLTILSPQAQGWRDGFSFGLTVGVNPADWSVRGSKEDGFKAWSSGSGIVAAQGIDIKVAEDTTLVGALLQATDGDISLDTGTLTVADLKDTDQYKNVGGSIGMSGGGLNSVGFSYEKKDKQGETRTTLDASGELNVTIRDADKDGIAGTEADKAAAEQLLASINKDASKYQEINKDSYTKLSGELDAQNLIEFGDNIKAIQNYQRAQNALAPGEIAAQGGRAVDVWRKMIINGASPEEATALGKSDLFASTVSMLESHDSALRHYGSEAAIPVSVRQAIALGQLVLFGQAAGDAGVRISVSCGTFGTCSVELAEFEASLANNVEAVNEQLALVRKGFVSAIIDSSSPLAAAYVAFQALLQCVEGDPTGGAEDLLAAYRGNQTLVHSMLRQAEGQASASSVISALLDFEQDRNGTVFAESFTGATRAMTTAELVVVGTIITTVAVGGITIAVAPELVAIVKLCGISPACYAAAGVPVQTIGITAGEIAAGDALGGGTLVVGAGAIAKADDIADALRLRQSAENIATGRRLNSQLIGLEVASGHAFEKHLLGGEFADLGITTRRQFQDFVEGIVSNPAVDRRYTKDGTVFYLDHKTRTVVISGQRGEATAFRPEFDVGWDTYINSSSVPKNKLPLEHDSVPNGRTY